ncbi:MAG: 4-oxalocrotonate decarboxylase [Myxococcales bacterium]|nr:4-oxalocrotonate decarboxylase [Myxococcales bacterium]
MNPLIASFADRLQRARLERREIARLTADYPQLTLPEAYAIQAQGIALRVAEGEHVMAWKMGLTSAGKRAQMNLDAPVYGVLTAAMRVDEGAVLSLATAIHCKVEPEVAFVLNQPLRAGMSREQAWACVAGVAAALEVLDSRYVGFKYFSLPDVVADNSSSFRYAVGPLVLPSEVDVRDLAMRMTVDGATVAQGRSSEISGDPVVSLIQLGDLAALYGQTVPAGTIVLSGAATAAVALVQACRVGLEIEGLVGLELTVQA